MKYGQQYAEALNASSEEFKQASIDYKQLKKSIKRIEKELNALGLNAQVLRELLSGGDLDAASSDDYPLVEGRQDQNASTNDPPAPLRKSGSTRSLSLNIASTRATMPLSPQKSRRRKKRQARARAEYELAGTVENPIPRIKLVFSSESSGSDTSLDGNSRPDDDLYNRLLRADSAKIVELSDSDEPTSRTRGREKGKEKAKGKGKESRSQSESSEIFDSKEVSSEDQDPHSSTSHTEDEEKDGAADKLIDKMYGHGLVPSSQVTPPGSPATIRPPASNGHLSYFRNGSLLPDDDGDADGHVVVQGPELLLRDLTLTSTNDEQDRIAEEADGESDGLVLKKAPSIKSTSSRRRLHTEGATSSNNGNSDNSPRRRSRRHRREVVINLEYDSEFFAMLNSALSSLTQLMNAEKASFMAAVKELAAIVKNTATPAKNKRDLYAWREVFSLWVEAEIFEGEREKDRGERVVQEIERRLNWFVDQVGRRKLAKKMKSKESRRALERFVELNQELLQLKRIGLANQEAARKILKKHDKRLGLSASQDFPDFVAQQKQLLNANLNGSGTAGSNSQALMALRGNNALIGRSALAKTATSNEMSSLIFLGLTTLPHALLTMFTDILLPVIPQIDDYSCIICGDLAWRPIALDCGHRFCVRCLVKMQKRGQDACPACRAPVVLKASKENLDAALMAYQRMWFPLEIKQKQRDDTKEIEKEYAEEMHLSGSGKCIIA